MKKSSIVLQDNLLTTARYDMSSIEKNIMYLAMELLQHGAEDPGIVKVSLKELEKGTRSSVDQGRFKKASYAFLKRRISVEVEGEFVGVNIVSSSHYRVGKGFVELEFSPEIVPMIFSLRERRLYTRVYLESVLALTSKYAKRLYEMLCQFRDTGKLFISVSELKERLCLVNEQTGEEKYTKWSMFKKFVLDIAVREINGKTDFVVTDWRAEKEGKKYTKLTFKFKEKQKQNISPKNSESPAPASKEAAKPAKWTHDQKNVYAGLTEYNRWFLGKEKFAKKLVINIPPSELAHAIVRYKELCEGGTPPPPVEYFAALLDAQESGESQAFSTPKIPNLAALSEAKKAGETRASSSRKKASLEETKPPKDMPEVVAKSAASAEQKVAVPPPPEVSALLQKLKKEEQEKTLGSTKATVGSVWMVKTEQPLELSPFASASWSWNEKDGCAEVVFAEGLGEEESAQIRDFFAIGSFFSRLKYQRLPQKINVVLEGNLKQYSR